MNLESLIQETAKKVIANMNPAGQVNQPMGFANLPVGKLIVIIDGTDEGLTHALAQVSTIMASGVKPQVVLSASVDPARVKVQGADVLHADTCVTVSDESIIFIPYLTVGFAGKIANLLEDETAGRVVTRGLIGQNKIFIGISELDLLINGKKRLSFGISQKLKEYQRLIKAYDLVMIKDINQVIKEAGAVSVVTASNAQTPPAAQQADSTSCVCSTGGCEGCGQCVNLNQNGVNNVIGSGADRVSAALGVQSINQAVAGMIDHTLLKPNATEAEVAKLCEEARKHKFASVCVNPSYVTQAARALQGSVVKVCTVIGFPLGATTSTTKALETRDAIANGATEIDMVINVGALKSGNNALVKKDIEAVVEASHSQAIVKVILETSLLTDEEKVRACLLSKYAGADFVKTATGFGPGGATVEDIALMRKTVGAEMGVKASGGIRDFATAQAMIAAGASRIGASASVAIVKGTTDSGKGY